MTVPESGGWDIEVRKTDQGEALYASRVQILFCKHCHSSTILNPSHDLGGVVDLF